MLLTSKISFSYDGQRLFNYPGLVCNAGETILITGKSGCGKSTFLHILTGLIRNYSGHIELNNVAIENLSESELNKFRQHIGIVFQKPQYISSLTMKDNILIAAREGYRQGNERLHQLCNELGVEKLLGRLPSKLSVGELQRISLVRALINNPAVVFADEPTSSLDDEHAQIVADLLISQSQKANAALIVVSHDGRIRSRFDKLIQLV